MDELVGIKRYLQDTIDRVAQNMATMTDGKGHNRYGSGNTAQSIAEQDPVYEVKTDGSIITIEIYMPEYYDYIDKGVNGLQVSQNSPYSFRTPSPPPLKSIRTFMLNRGIVPRDKSGKRKPITESSLNGLAYAIGRKIKMNGVEGVPFYSSVINDKWLNGLADQLIIAYGSEVMEKFDVVFKSPDRNV